MDEWKLAGVLGILVVIGTAAVGVVAFLGNYLFDASDGARLTPTFAVLFVTVLFVFALVALGAGAGRWLRNPYW